MIARVKVSSRNQIAVPAEARKKLDIKPGDYLRVKIEGRVITLVPEPERHSDRLRGLGAEIWKDVDPVEYVRAEREAWRSSEADIGDSGA